MRREIRKHCSDTRSTEQENRWAIQGLGLKSSWLLLLVVLHFGRKTQKLIRMGVLLQRTCAKSWEWWWENHCKICFNCRRILLNELDQKSLPNMRD